MAPPTKRRKRNVVQTSDDEEEEGQFGQTKSQANTINNYLFSSPEKPRPAPTTTNATRQAATSPTPNPSRKSSRLLSKPAIKPLQPQNPNSSGIAKNDFKSASASPEKARTRPVSKGSQSEKGKSADLVTLFSRQAERAPKAPRVPPKKLDDIISDPISVSDDDEVGEHRAAVASRVGETARKRFRDNTSQATSASSVPASQKFLRPSRPPVDHDTDDGHRPWSERFTPSNLSELAVHTRKVADVRRWIEGVMAGRLRQRLLILKGAAGAGKTTTVRLLAKDMKCELLEWRNPTGSFGAAQGFQSASAQFDEFMGRGSKFAQLETDVEIASPPSSANDKARDDTRKLILIEEFPNTFARSSTALTSFRNTIIEFLSRSTPSLATLGRQEPEPITPVVMIISETLLTTTSASADSFTAHRLLGPEIMRHPGAGIIEFNPVAPTILASALELIVQKEARKSGRKRTPGPLVLKRLGEIGDIRSAISSLEFLCLKGDSNTDWGSKVTFTKPKRGGKNGVALTKGESESLQLVSQREATLGIFHAVGKVVYNKRGEVPIDRRTPEGQAEILPEYLASYSRPKQSEVSVDSLIDETGTDTHTFISALHENYALSCESTGPSDPNSPVDYMNGCIEYLSDSDLLCPSWDIFFGGRRGGGGGSYGRDSSQVLRQDEITFQVATRGLLFSLPCPVKRVKTAPPGRIGGSGGDAYKLFYPTSLKLWRDKEELEALVDHWATTLLKGGHNEAGLNRLTDGASAFRRPRTAANSSNTNTNTSGGDWISRQAALSQDQPPPTAAPPLLSLGSSARREMLLERLPYMAHIARGQQQQRRTNNTSSLQLLLTGARAKEIEKVVSFTGIGGPPADEEAVVPDADDDDSPAAAATNGGGGGGGDGAGGQDWATDKPTEEGSSPRKKRVLRPGIRPRNAGTAAEEEDIQAAAALPSVQGLVISDDDIEDD
ncbi:RFC checkpoint protein Rad17 [Diatrype stigma]|uniref:RFC checkpoint protein Rad17 n=1 Tax=Diatrype stigma TaxID=117547 RepID=A0AAN9UNT7_9PEZI